MRIKIIVMSGAFALLFSIVGDLHAASSETIVASVRRHHVVYRIVQVTRPNRSAVYRLERIMGRKRKILWTSHKGIRSAQVRGVPVAVAERLDRKVLAWREGKFGERGLAAWRKTEQEDFGGMGIDPLLLERGTAIRKKTRVHAAQHAARHARRKSKPHAKPAVASVPGGSGLATLAREVGECRGRLAAEDAILTGQPADWEQVPRIPDGLDRTIADAYRGGFEDAYRRIIREASAGRDREYLERRRGQEAGFMVASMILMQLKDATPDHAAAVIREAVCSDRAPAYRQGFREAIELAAEKAAKPVARIRKDR